MLGICTPFRFRPDSAWILKGAFLLAVAAVGGRAGADDSDAKQHAWEESFEKDILPLLKTHCFECHGEDSPDGDLNLSRYTDGKKAARRRSTWQRVGKRVRLGEMPPEDSPQLTDEQKSQLRIWIESRPREDVCGSIANEETQKWYPGYVMSRRLTATEYKNALRDLLQIPINPNWNLPSDGAGGEGFDTAGDALFTSPIHIERYLSIASKVIDSIIFAPSDADTEVSATFAAARTRLLGNLENSSNPQTDQIRSALRRFANRAWRRDVKEDELDRLIAIYHATLSDDSDATEETTLSAIAQPLKAILISPHFLFVVETESEAGGIQKLTPYQLATRLALLLWSSIPDDALLQKANANQLQTPEQLNAELTRMLADPKSETLGSNFGMQWLGLTQFQRNIRPDTELFPEYNEQLASDLAHEAAYTVADIFRANRSVLELIDSKGAYINGNLAKHYDLDLPSDAPWQRVLTDQRGGVITLGAVLANTSYPRRTSPVLRGRWMIEEVLGDRVPPPPEDVPALEDAHVSQAATLRERLEEHRKNPKCAVCHNRMDPLGFGLENYDALGRWREEDRGTQIDASGKLPSGKEFNGSAELKSILMERSSDFETHFIKKLLGFALGRELNRYDECVVTDVTKQLDANGHGARVILETIINSFPFQHRYFKAASSNPEP